MRMRLAAESTSERPTPKGLRATRRTGYALGGWRGQSGPFLGHLGDTPGSVERGRFTLAVYTSVTFFWPPLNVGDPHVYL
jgi:hypothetical protein